MRYLLSITLFIFIFSCKENKPQVSDNYFEKNIYQKNQDEKIEMNKQFVKNQVIMIDSLLKNNADFKTKKFSRSNTGLYYEIYGTAKGIQPKVGDLVSIKYNSYLLPSKELAYNTIGDTLCTFILQKDRFEKGVQEGIMLMKEGQKADFILPSHLAHGLSGDNDLVPPGAIMWFKVELVKVETIEK